jgi:hypothetical protein
LWNIDNPSKIAKVDFYVGIGTGSINDIVETPSFDGLEFACAADRGVFIIYELKGRLVQKVSEEILKETGVK